jgi:hypothetical protein
MSYSLAYKCGICSKKDKCTDRHFIDGAICGIHSVWPAEKGHLGAGSSVIDCVNFEEEERKQ